MSKLPFAQSPHPPRNVFTVPLRATAMVVALAACDRGDAGREVDGPEPNEPVGEASQAQTVGEAMQNTCSTGSVRGLSLQIIEQGNCISPGAFVELPALDNVAYGENVFPFLEQPARDAFVAAAQSTDLQMTVNSMLRSVAQQYLLYRWYQTGRCDIGLAAVPGNSNHETGLAFDTSQYSAWRSTLEAHGFSWFGSADDVHFDYEGAGAVDYRGTDVKAFQILWNRNHPDDPIDEDGDWGPQTEARMAMAPADGFALGPDCGGPTPTGVQIEPTVSIAGVTDLFSDGASAAVGDTFEGASHEVSILVADVGDAPAGGVVLGVEIDDPWLSASSYLIETDFEHPGEFTENDANAAPENPSHDAPLPGRFELVLYGISAGETKRVALALAASGTSVQQPTQPGVRVWVKHIDDHYDQEAPGGEISGDGSQAFNGGRLEVLTPIDVYSRTRWEFQTDRREGWTGDDGAIVSLEGGALTGTGTALRSPALETGGEAITTLRVRAKRDGGQGDAWVHVLDDAADPLDAGTAIPLDLPSDGAFHEVDVDVRAAARVPGAIAIEPFDGGGGSIAVDWVRVDRGGASGGGGGDDDGPGDDDDDSAGGDDGAGGGAAGDAAEDGGEGCSCRTAGGDGSRGAGWPIGATALIFAALARRRRAVR